MIERIDFQNFKILRATKLALGRFTLIVGPNGSGKSTALQAIEAIASPQSFGVDDLISAGQRGKVKIVVTWGPPQGSASTEVQWKSGTPALSRHKGLDGQF